ncbi:DUF397 domain-containing protein [Streptomyces sodiiphilus]|uniref:DUF397 domain-containing protein n=1 Tax=Streptomyces sodiiphilus TaxID=226217 RepID=A0ABP5A4U4_9ACTN
MNDARAQLHAHDLTAAHWRKASASGPEHNCVEVTDLPSGIAVRDSKDTSRTPLRFTAERWTDFQQALTTGLL